MVYKIQRLLNSNLKIILGALKLILTIPSRYRTRGFFTANVWKTWTYDDMKVSIKTYADLQRSTQIQTHTRLRLKVSSPEEAGVLPVYEIDAFKIIKNDSLN